MIKHIVVWPMKEETTAGQKAEMKARLEALQDRVKELIYIEIGIDAAGGTMSLYSTFASKKDLDAYQAHPAHQDVVAFVKPLVAGRAVCDYLC